MSIFLRTTTLLLTLCIGCWAGSAQAGQIRYDVTLFEGPGSPVNGSGYMVFNDNGPAPGNIFPNIVDWYFDIGGFIFNPANTQAHSSGLFEVDANYYYVNDYLDLATAGPTFCSDGCAGSPSTFLRFSKAFSLGGQGIARVQYPSGSGSNSYLEIGVNIDYSDPIVVNEVPLPSVLGLFAIALASLARSRGGIAR